MAVRHHQLGKRSEHAITCINSLIICHHRKIHLNIYVVTYTLLYRSRDSRGFLEACFSSRILRMHVVSMSARGGHVGECNNNDVVFGLL